MKTKTKESENKGTRSVATTDLQRLVTPTEAARACGVSIQTIFRYIDQGDLAAVKLGKKTVRIKLTELERFMEGKR
jgi:excisionase family DNA binding protein